MKNILLWLGLLFQTAAINCFAATEADSLLRLLPDQPDKQKIKLLNKLSKVYKTTQSSLSLGYAEQALSLSLKIQDTTAIIQSYNSIGEFYLDEGQYEAARKVFVKSLALATMHNDSLLKATSTAKMAVVMYFTNQYADAFDYQHRALQIFKKKNALPQQADALSAMGYILDKQGYQQNALVYLWDAFKLRQQIGNIDEIAKSLNGIGDLYARQNHWNDAIKYYMKAYEQSKAANNAKGVSIALNNMGVVYGQQGRYDEAISHLFESLAKKRTIGNKKEIGITLRNIGNLYTSIKKYKDALDYYGQALEIQQQLGDKSSLYKTHRQIGLCYQAQKQYEKAFNSYKDALKQANILESQLLLKEINEDIAHLFLEQNNAEMFMKYYRAMKEHSDSLQNSVQLTRIHELQVAYEQEENTRKIAALQAAQRAQQEALSNEKTTKNALFFGVIISSVLVGLIFLFYRLKIDANSQLEEQNNIIIQQNTELNTANRELQGLNKTLQESEQELRKSNNTKNKFFSIISHDLRGPLATLSSFLSLLIKYNDKLSREELVSLASDIEKSLKNVSMLLDNLLQWSQSQMNVISFKPEALPLQERISDTINLLSAHANKKNIKLSIQNNAPFVILADKDMFDFVLRNLISNAIKFTPQLGEVNVSAHLSDKFAFVSVTDTGIGISPEQYEKLFQLSRLSTPGTQGETGTGLGLVLCKEFIEKHGGNITVQRLEKGTTFTFSVPLAFAQKVG